MVPQAIQWQNDTFSLKLIDQTRLPIRLDYLICYTYTDVCTAIKRLAVRGAPAIGLAAAYGVVLAAGQAPDSNPDERNTFIRQAILELSLTRPTAVNLFWALDRMSFVLRENEKKSSTELKESLLTEALYLHEDDRLRCRKIGKNGLTLLNDGDTILTHCNAGALATGGIGTALAPIYLGHEKGMRLTIFADETRPLLQGARLTAWELMQAGIEVTLISDSAAAYTISRKAVDCVIVGADRITRNGDVANKIGTYSLAITAKLHNIPLYVAAPLSTFDLSLDHGREIPIEEHQAETITESFDRRIAPLEVKTFVPAFDVTPNQYISAIITEKGILRPPLSDSIADLLT